MPGKYDQVEGKQLKRFEIPYWDGLNILVADNLAKRSEPAFFENVRSKRVGWLEKREGFTLFGNDIGATANFGLYDFNTSSHRLYRISTVSGITKIFKYGSSVWNALTGAGSGLSAADMDFTTGFSRCFLVNGTDVNRNIEPDGTTVVDATTSSGFMYNSPKAFLVNYFQGKVYLANYFRPDGTQERTGICFSSPPVGIVSLVNGDQTAPITTLAVTDTKYIKAGAANDTLDIYRGGTLIGTITVTGRTENSLTINSFATDLLSSDELWVAGTHQGEKKIRWDNNSTGIATEEYDSFKNVSEEDIVMMTNVGSNMITFTKNSISVWNNQVLRPLDLEIGCVSKNSFVKILGQGVFLHYSGLYTLTEGSPRLISAKIQPIFDNADPVALENSVASSDGFSYFVTVGDIPFYNNDGSKKVILKDVVVEYNLRQNNFFIHTGVDMTEFTRFTDTNTQKLLFAKNSDSNIYRFLDGTTDAGKEIKFNAETHELNPGITFESIVEPRQLIVEIKQGQNIGLFVAYDNGPYMEIGKVSRGCNIIDIPNKLGTEDFPRCRTVKFALREFSKSRVIVGRAALAYYETAEVEGNRET